MQTSKSAAAWDSLDINRPERELLVLKWMVGLVLGGIVALVLKAFFPL